LAAWVQIAVVTLLMVLTFRFNLLRLWLKTNPFTGEPNWGHSICIPFIGLYYLYLNREELLKATVKPLLAGNFSRARFVSAGLCIAAGVGAMVVGPHVMPSQAARLMTMGQALGALGVMVAALDWGLAMLFAGLLTFAYGIWPGQNDFVKDFGMVMTLFGVVLTLCGWDVMRIAWFPIVFLVCALPWPGLVYSWVATPLQDLAANVAVKTMQLTGVTAQQIGTKIRIGDGISRPVHTLNVAEACAGMRSLMTFISVGAAIAFLSSRPLWQKVLITLSGIPIAIFCNVMRVSGQGLLDTYVSTELANGFAHQFVGMVMLIPAFFLLLLVCWILDHLFVEEIEGADRAHAGIVKAPAAPAQSLVQKQVQADGVTIPVPRRRVPRRPTLPERHGVVDPGIIIAPMQPPPRDSA
jgi:exosortase